MKKIEELLQEHAAWTVQHFPNQNASLSLIGMFEEYGEYCQANNAGQAADAIADSALFMVGFARLSGLDFLRAWEHSRTRLGASGRVWSVVLGKLSHHYLKRSQGTRGGYQEHTEAMQDLLRQLLLVWRTENPGFEMLLFEIWELVKLRGRPNEPSVQRTAVQRTIETAYRDWSRTLSKLAEGPEREQPKCPWCEKPVTETLSHARGKCDV